MNKRIHLKHDKQKMKNEKKLNTKPKLAGRSLPIDRSKGYAN